MEFSSEEQNLLNTASKVDTYRMLAKLSFMGMLVGCVGAIIMIVISVYDMLAQASLDRAYLLGYAILMVGFFFFQYGYAMFRVQALSLIKKLNEQKDES
ncbi:hypothetical protein ACFL1X_13650 [Candidatus Hydrogenedentota bacterium]